MKILLADFGLEVRYDGGSTAEVFLSYDYWNQTCGLCGTFDGNKDNDLRLPTGELVSTNKLRIGPFQVIASY